MLQLFSCISVQADFLKFSNLDLCTKETQHYFAHKGFQFDSAQIVALILKHTKAILWPLCLLVPTSCLLIHTSLWVAEGQLFD